MPQSARITVPATALTQQGFNAWATSGKVPDVARVSWIAGQLVVE